MEGFIEELAGLLVWIVANVVYADARRRGTGGAYRFFGFWLGLPLTWIWLMTIREGSQPNIAPPPDDDDALFAEVRRDRGLRGPERDGTDEGTRQEEDA